MHILSKNVNFSHSLCLSAYIYVKKCNINIYLYIFFSLLTFCRLVEALPNAIFPSEFSIDPAHELALFILSSVNGTRLTPASSYHCSRAPNFTMKKGQAVKDCAIYRKEFKPCTKVRENDKFNLRKIGGNRSLNDFFLKRNVCDL